ncbi:MAG: hypothetical protein Q4Q07_02825 [Tissierellia bacterium]|nr:hypothetical protein [Tissierellia bacterium]
MKKRIVFILAITMILSFGMNVFAKPESVDAQVSKQKVTFDDLDAKIGAYNIHGENYFKLRDLAALITGTKSSFNVIYDKKSDSVTIMTNEIYEKQKGDLAPLPTGNKKGVPTPQKLFIIYVEEPNKTKPLEIKGYNIEGNNYFRLRDLGEKVGFGVAYNYNTNTVMIDSDFPDIKDIPKTNDQPVNKKPIIKLFGSPRAFETIEAKKILGRSHHGFEFMDTDHNPKAKAEFDALGGGKLPLIVIGDTKISGYEPEKILEALNNL